MFSLRVLVRPSVLAPTLTAAAAICGLVIWHAHASAPVPQVPSIDVDSESPATGWSVHLTSSADVSLAPPTPAPFQLQLDPPPKDVDGIGDWGYRPFAHDDRFPVVSPEGTVAVLFEDEEDFTGASITTLVAWSKSGVRVASFSIGGHTWNGNEQSVLNNANAWLARSTWRSLGEASASWSDEQTLQTITLAAGDPLVFDANTGHLKRGHHTLRADFGAPGTVMSPEPDESGSCGSITGIDRAYSTKHLVVLVPRLNLGGDSCFGAPSADVATAVALR